jgi:hypothetical protein
MANMALRQYKKKLLTLAPAHKVGSADIYRAYKEMKGHIPDDIRADLDKPVLEDSTVKKTKLKNCLYVWVRNTLIRHGSSDAIERGNI